MLETNKYWLSWEQTCAWEEVTQECGLAVIYACTEGGTRLPIAHTLRLLSTQKLGLWGCNLESHANISFAKGGAHLPIAHTLRLLSTHLL